MSKKKPKMLDSKNNLRLIEEVKIRPVLWNHHLPDRVKKRMDTAWLDVCYGLIKGFGNYRSPQKKKIEVSVRTRWHTLRDSYWRYLKRSKPFKYDSQLSFLKILRIHRSKGKKIPSIRKNMIEENSEGHQAIQNCSPSVESSNDVQNYEQPLVSLENVDSVPLKDVLKEKGNGKGSEVAHANVLSDRLSFSKKIPDKSPLTVEVSTSMEEAVEKEPQESIVEEPTSSVTPQESISKEASSASKAKENSHKDLESPSKEASFHVKAKEASIKDIIRKFMESQQNERESQRNERERDDDRDFFMSMLPMVRALDNNQKLEFRLQVMKLLKSIRSTQHSSPLLPQSQRLMNSVPTLQQNRNIRPLLTQVPDNAASSSVDSASFSSNSASSSAQVLSEQLCQTILESFENLDCEISDVLDIPVHDLYN